VDLPVVEIVGFEAGVTEYSVPVVIISIDVVDDKNVVEVLANESVVDSISSVVTVISDVVLNGSLDVVVPLLCSIIAVVVVVDKGKLVLVVRMLAVLI
jgi:hypothetical protein